MKYWLDTEFIERGSSKPIDLVSIGVVAEDGREYYAISLDFDARHASPWVKENVLAVLPPRHCTPHLAGTALFHESGAWKPRSRIADDLRVFCDPNRYGKPEFWGYYCDYDWVVLCQTFGDMMALPKGWPMYCRDLKQWCDELGNPRLPEQGKDEHHALADAKWNRYVWSLLKGYAAMKRIAGEEAA